MRMSSGCNRPAAASRYFGNRTRRAASHSKDARSADARTRQTLAATSLRGLFPASGGIIDRRPHGTPFAVHAAADNPRTMADAASRGASPPESRGRWRRATWRCPSERLGAGQGVVPAPLGEEADGAGVGRWRGDARQHFGGDGADVAVAVAEGRGGDAFDRVDVFAGVKRVEECKDGIHPHLVFGCPAACDLRFLPGRIRLRQQAFDLRQRWRNRLADCAQRIERLARHLAVRIVERGGQPRRGALRGRPDFAEREGRR